MAKIRDLETIYKIFDPGDDNYSPWYGTVDDIINYLHELGITKCCEDGWIQELENQGLSFEMLN